MSDKIIELVKEDRIKKTLPLYNEILTDLDKKPSIDWKSWLFRSISFLTMFVALVLASISVYFSSTSSKHYGTNYVLVDVQNPYILNPQLPTITPYSPDASKALQDWVFRAGPGAQYNGIGGNSSGTPGSGDKQFEFDLPSSAPLDQIISVTNASISEIVQGSNNEPTNGPGVHPFSIKVKFPSGNILQIPKKSSKTFVFHMNGWYNVGQMDENV